MLPIKTVSVTFDALTDTLMCRECEGVSGADCDACHGSGLSWQVAELYRAYPIIREALDFLADVPDSCVHDRVVPHAVPVLNIGSGAGDLQEWCPGP